MQMRGANNVLLRYWHHAAVFKFIPGTVYVEIQVMAVKGTTYIFLALYEMLSTVGSS